MGVMVVNNLHDTPNINSHHINSITIAVLKYLPTEGNNSEPYNSEQENNDCNRDINNNIIINDEKSTDTIGTN